jgi:hypothetical protein
MQERKEKLQDASDKRKIQRIRDITKKIQAMKEDGYCQDLKPSISIPNAKECIARPQAVKMKESQFNARKKVIASRS